MMINIEMDKTEWETIKSKVKKTGMKLQVWASRILIEQSKKIKTGGK